MENCIIIHGCPSKSEKSINPRNRTYHKHWIPWVRKELEGKGFSVRTPLMPEPWEPKYIKWKRILDKLGVNEDSVLVGHSCGGGFLVRYLGDNSMKVKKLILVAPAISHSGNYNPLSDLLNYKINKNVKNNVDEIILFVSTNDSKGILKSVEIFSDALDVKPIELRGRGHFTFDDMGTEEFSELLEEILE